MSDRILAFVALLTLIAFLAVVPIFVPDPDLIVVTVFVVALAVWDFLPTLKPGSKSEPDGRR